MEFVLASRIKPKEKYVRISIKEIWGILDGPSKNKEFVELRSDFDGRGVCYPVCGMMHVKEPLLLIGKSSPCGGSGFPLSLSEWSFTICMTPYNRK